jgi:chromosome segregation ATPase
VGDDAKTELVATQRELEACEVALAARDAEVAMVRGDCGVFMRQRNDDHSKLLIAEQGLKEMEKTLDEVWAQLTARDTRIQELENGQREMEEQLDEANDNSADVAHAITAGADIMMA